jgi:hypothetical protein
MTSIKEMLTYGVAKRQRTWGRDRAETIGASEIGQCARKTWFAKHGATPDSDYEDSWGARERGNLIENHHWEPAIRSYLTDTYGERVEFLLAGEDQETLVDGYLSATPDGLVVNRSNQVLTIAGVDLEPNDGLVLECKSIDPRVELKAEKGRARLSDAGADRPAPSARSGDQHHQGGHYLYRCLVFRRCVRIYRHL